MRSDWISPWWQAALLPDKWDVCGIIVPSLSVWHTFALESLANAYLLNIKEVPPDIDDATSLLAIASLPYSKGKQLFMPNRAYYRGGHFGRVCRRLKRMEWECIDAACTEYVQTCLRSASRWQKQGQAAGAVPYQWHLVRLLANGDPAKVGEAWNFPYSQARALYDAFAESKGDTSLMQPRAQEMEDNWADYQPKETSGGNGSS